MAVAETARLVAQLDLGGNFVKNLGGANRALTKFDTQIDRTQSKAFQTGQKIGTGIKAGVAIAAAGFGILAFNIERGLQSLVELEQQTAQTNAVIKATGGVAGVSAQQVGILSEKYEDLNATIGDEVIRSGENLLLTFTNIRGKAFEPALASILDMNTALGRGPEGLNTTVTQVGKALQNPSKGLGQLERAIGKLDPKVKKQIDSLVKQGKLYQAQTVLLGELDKRYKGSFLAQGGTTAGKVAKFKDAIEDLQRALAEALLPALGNVADALSTFLKDPQTVTDIRNLGQDIAKLFSRENITNGINALKTGFQFLKDAAGAISTIVSTAVKAFTSLPPEIQKLLVGGFVVNKLTGGLVTDLIEGVAKTALQKIGLMTVQAAVVNVTGGVGGAPVPGGAGGAAAEETKTVSRISRLIEAASKILLIGFVAEAAATFHDEISSAGRDLHDEVFGKGGGLNLPTTDLSWPWGPKNTPTILPEIFGGNGLLGGTAENLNNAADHLNTAAAELASGAGADRHGGAGLTFTGLQSIAAAFAKVAQRQTRIEARRADIAKNKEFLKHATPQQAQKLKLQIKIDQAVLAKELAKVIHQSQRDNRPHITPPKEPKGDQSIAAAFGKTATAIGDSFDRAVVPTTNAVNALSGDVMAASDKQIAASYAQFGGLGTVVQSGLGDVNRSTGSVENAVKSADQQISTSGSIVAGAASLAGYQAAAATSAAGGAIVGAIQANRPIIDVAVNISATTIQKTVTVTDRNGPYGGSAIQDNPNSRT